eukprot:m.345597 g.345597  ORF g.345597 m.345597 type:complete len:158 (+) comp26829_c0_seq1:193-666(+)
MSTLLRLRATGQSLLKKHNSARCFVQGKTSSTVVSIQTRYADNDMQAHINNVAYYSYMDTAIASIFNDNTDVFPRYVVETGLVYHAPASHPDTINVDISVRKIGNSSVTYNVEMYSTRNDTKLCSGKFVHVYVDKDSQRPVSIPEEHREVMLGIMEN